MTDGTLSPEDLDLLRRPLYGFLSTAGGPTPPQPRPVWFEVTAEGTIALFSEPGAPKVRRLRRDPRASLVVAAPVGERERWVSVTGDVTLRAGGAHDLVTRLFARYHGADAPARPEELAGHARPGLGRARPAAAAVRRFRN